MMPKVAPFFVVESEIRMSRREDVHTAALRMAFQRGLSISFAGSLTKSRQSSRSSIENRLPVEAAITDYLIIFSSHRRGLTIRPRMLR